MKVLIKRSQLQKLFTTEQKRRVYYYASLWVLVGVLVLLGAGSVFFPNPTMSLLEKRELAKMPAFSVEAFFSGQYIRDLEAFYADTFPLREGFVGLAAFVENMKGLRPNEVKIYEQAPQEPPPPVRSESVPAGAGEMTESNPNIPNVPQTTTPAARDYEPNSLAAGEVSQLGATFICKDRALTLFGGNRDVGLYYAQVVNNYASALEGKVKVYDMIIPTAVEYGLPDEYKKLSASQKDNIDYIYGNMSSLVATVDAYSQLEAHYYNEYLYFRTDHHWTGLGAYYAYRAFADKAGFTPLSLSDYETKRLDGTFLGTLYAMTQDPMLKEHPDYLEYYVNPTSSKAFLYQRNNPDTPLERDVFATYAKGGNSYSLFLHGDWPLLRIDTGVKNGRKIAVVKESFGNAFIPFLIDHYEQIYVVDQRHFQTSLTELLEQNGIGELLFCNNIFAANTNFHVECIKSLQYQVYMPDAIVSSSSKEESASSESESEDDIIIIS